jgi:hypothetical protein
MNPREQSIPPLVVNISLPPPSPRAETFLMIFEQLDDPGVVIEELGGQKSAEGQSEWGEWQ